MKRKTKRHWLESLFLAALVIACAVVALVYSVTVGAALLIIPLGLLIAWILQKVQHRGPVE